MQMLGGKGQLYCFSAAVLLFLPTKQLHNQMLPVDSYTNKCGVAASCPVLDGFWTTGPFQKWHRSTECMLCSVACNWKSCCSGCLPTCYAIEWAGAVMRQCGERCVEIHFLVNCSYDTLCVCFDLALRRWTNYVLYIVHYVPVCVESDD